MSWSELLPSGRPPAPPLNELILAALAEAALARRAAPGYCADCRPGAPCTDHRDAAAEADDYEAAYMQVAVGSGRWCDLAVAIAAGSN